MATLTMWSLNVADFSRDYRVYAIDVMGQPGRSVPDEPIGSIEDYVAWLTSTLDALHLDRVFLAGMSFGGWLALNYAVAAPRRIQKLALLSPGGLLPMVRQFGLRGMLMVTLPTRVTVNSFMRWLGISGRAFESMLDLMYLGLKHFRMPIETLRIMPAVVSDEALRAMAVPTLLLIGEGEVISDPAEALARARRLIPDFRGDLIPRSRHEMCSSQPGIVDARVLDFLKDDRSSVPERVVA
jgi:pimeloyl-ACP methyl ester carboxylesterase